LTTLSAVTQEAAGSNCSTGGNKITAGLDTNGNGVLDTAEVSTTAYNCSGAPGPGITWVNVTSTSVQAESNKGYLANNAAEVVVTLPAAPAIGDLVQISGAGTGGWKLAQNAGQSILVKGLPSGAVPAGETWTPRESQRWWRALASSADGSKLVAGVYGGGYIYTSAPDRTTLGAGGWLSGAQFDSLLLQYTGGGVFTPVSYVSYSGVFSGN
jgi:hypothetical protein